ncbi:MAG TPA: hypothetical protein VM582_00460, partial [Candidatus Thermoplasmatota archaeon]|nr:hypothetical protein [Candidatus Thermoplasmatota archaeon]
PRMPDDPTDPRRPRGRPPHSVSPSSFDPTTVSGAPRPGARALPPGSLELAVEGPVVRKTATVQIRPEDKEVFDALQAWWFLRHGRRVTQWELFTELLAAATEARGGPFAGALEVA